MQYHLKYKFLLLSYLVIGSSLLQSNAEQLNQELRLSPNYGKVRKNVNDSYHVTCLSSHSNDTFWVNPKGQRIINSHESSIRVEVKNHGVDLHINEISLSDEGVYKCVFLKGSRSRAAFELDVIRFDETQTIDPIEYDKTLSRQVAFEGQPYMMKCAVRGNAAPRLLWSVDGQIPDKEKYRITWEGLQILNVSETDADKHFTCRAFSSHTSVSESEMMNITLRIRMEPRSRQIGNLGMKSYGVIGEWANLTCAVRAEPAVTFEWFHQGQPIQNASDIRITNEENQSTLRVLLDDDNEEKLGYYMCRAINELGHLVQTIILLKVEKPPPPILNVLSVSPDEVQISAKTSYSRMGKRFPPLGYTIQYIPHCRTATENSENDWIPANGHSRPLENHDGFVLTKLSHGTAYCIRAAVLNVATVGFFSPPLKVVTRLANAEKVKDQTAGNSRILPSAFSIVMMAMITGFPVTQIVTYR